MTLELLNKIYEENNIPKDALLQSDSGWECGATDMDGVFYSEEQNTVYITQGDSWEIAHGYRYDPGDCVLVYVTDEALDEYVRWYSALEEDKKIARWYSALGVNKRFSDALKRKLMDIHERTKKED